MEKGKLRSLSIEIENGLLKIKSRINATEGITPTQSRPPVLCGDHHIAKLYIDYVHRRLHHAGAEATINECRTKYWISTRNTWPMGRVSRIYPGNDGVPRDTSSRRADKRRRASTTGQEDGGVS
ncbi:unnamed protein product [Colias eurytheme]|nr:unnamed protein product [Colias eurytheme]